MTVPILGTIVPNMGTNKVAIAKILFSKTQQNILRLLYGRPDADFYTNEIIQFSCLGRGTIQRELIKLTSAGLIFVKKIGHQKHYQANRSNPIFAELRSIILKTFGLADVIRKALKPVTKNIYFAFIYGSLAKQEDTANSDIDLMIISDQLTYAELFKILEKTEIQVGRKINPTFYSLSEWSRKQKEANYFVNQVRKQAKIFLIGTEDEFSAIK